MDGNKFWAGMFELTPVEGEAGDWGTSQVRRKCDTKCFFANRADSGIFRAREEWVSVRVWS